MKLKMTFPVLPADAHNPFLSIAVVNDLASNPARGRSGRLRSKLSCVLPVAYRFGTDLLKVWESENIAQSSRGLPKKKV
jgi:hypothetical protein